jgi:hypothetical protein
MDSNTYSMPAPGGLDRLTAAVDELATQDLDALPDSEAARRVLVLRGLIERLEGVFLRELAGVDSRGAAGAGQDVPVESTAAWLRARTRMGHPDAHQRVRVARAPCTAAPSVGPPRRWPPGRSATCRRRR